MEELKTVHFLSRVLLILFLLSGAACSGTFQHQIEFNPNESLRVAILPFVQVDETGEMIEESGSLVVDGVPLLSKEVEATPPELVRRLVQTELHGTGLDVLSPSLIDAELPHHGFGRPDGSFDLKKIYAADPKEICVHFLDCDAVLRGRVVKWERSYYGVQTVNAVGIELELISVRTAEPLFTSTGEDSESRGLSKGPTGYSSVVLEPIRGLDSDIIEDLARRVVKEMLQPLSVQQRPEYLESPPPSIFASSHDVTDGQIDLGEPLLVVVYGSSNMSASFSIGNLVENIPMIETSDGHYFGEYYPLEIDSFQSQSVRVRLTDQYGRSTEQSIARQPISLK